MNERELTAEDRAKIASKAQAAAHRALRETHEAEYQASYQEAKRELTEAAERHGPGVI
jgi:hypothetical protein